MKTLATLIVFGALSSSALAEGLSKEEQMARFLGKVPEWGEPARQQAARERIRNQYDSEVRAAVSSSYGSYGSYGSPSRVGKTSEILGKLGTPSSVYRSSGGYEVRTYRAGGGIYQFTLKDGVVKSTSSYTSR